MKIKKVLKICIVLFTCFIFFSCSAKYTIEDFGFAIERIYTSNLPREAFDAHYAYYFLNPEVGINAQQHFISYMETYKGMGFMIINDKAVLTDQSLSNIRIGLLYEKMGKAELAKRHYDMAVDLYKQTGKEDITKKRLVKLINYMDNHFATWVEEKSYDKDTPKELVYKKYYEEQLEDNNNE